MPRHIITAQERGHRPRIDPRQETRLYSIRVPADIHAALRWCKADDVRDALYMVARRAMDQRREQGLTNKPNSGIL